MFRFFRRSKSPKYAKTRKSQCKPQGRRRTFEMLEDRSVLSSYSVVNLNDHGAGSLRQAMLDANQHAGADVINFSVAGTIKLTTGGLPTITGPVNIDGTTAPGFAGTPLVEIDNNRFAGLQYIPGSSGSALRSLSLVNAGSNAVTFFSVGNMLVVGNYIGVALNGASLANFANGLALYSSNGNTIGGSTAQDRNVISANMGSGISMSSSSNNAILGNYIGTDVTGTLDRGNLQSGIVVTAGSSNVIGEASGNVISGNDVDGIQLSVSNDNRIAVNNIGTDVTGTADLGNSQNGILVTNGSAPI